MELTHSFTVPAPPEQTWELLTDLNRVGSCFPGATVKEATDTEFSGTVKVKLGPIAMLYSGSGTFVERDDAAHRAKIEAKGKDRRGNGTASATVTMSLTAEGDGTRADVTTDLQVTGKPAQFGRGVMQDVSDKLLGQFIDCIEQQLSGDEPSDSEAEAGGAAAAGAVSDAPSSEAKPAAAGAAQPAADNQKPAADTQQPSPPAEPPKPPPAPPRPPSSPSRAHPPAPRDEAIDLGNVVGPVLLQRYGGLAAVGLLGLLIGWLLGRRG
ncbi:SRPBCC family protein [Georgenia alba]|uniref:SRPBCC family protein n=1 Tax=Georgenia alba TaxID=2233858 RepID=A0ABW2Q704_9MICO